MEEHERIELRSDDVQEIIGTPPRWIVRWGTLVVSLAMIALVSMSFFVRYPDKVRGAVVVTSKTAPVRLKSPQSDFMMQILVEDGSTVKEGDLLVVMKDAGNYEDVEALEELVQELRDADQQTLMEFLPSDFEKWEIGALQPSYSQVQTDFRNLKFTEENQYAQKRISDIKNLINYEREGIKNLESTLKNAKNKRNLASKKVTRYKKLGEDISKDRLDAAINNFLQEKANVQAIESRINDKKLSLSSYSGQIATLQDQFTEETNTNSIQLEKSINNLLGEIDRWNEQNLLIAPMDGKIDMTRNWSEKQYVEQGTEILVIAPDDMNKNLFIEMFIPIEGSGRVEVGQRVLIKLDNYPYREYGQIDGEIIEEPGISRDNALPVKIKLTNGLITRYGKELKFEQELRGLGEIITEDKNVFHRIFENIIQPFKE